MLSKKYILTGALAIVLAAFALAGCAHNSSYIMPSGEDGTSASENVPPPYTGPINPLTGLPLERGSVNDRPIAVMLNNLKKATPQKGVSQADIIYEVPAEGGITRMLAVYQNAENAGEIGSVRSSRPYYLELALGHDAIYLHAGGSPDAYEKIKAWNVTALDCVRGPYEGSLFWRDAQRRRTMGYEHSVLTSGTAIADYFPTYSFRKTHENGYTYNMTFKEDGTPEEGQLAQTVTVPFSHYKTGSFQYDEQRACYLVSQYNAPYVDGNTGEQVGVDNLLILKTACEVIPGDDHGRLTVNLTSGKGFYACGGKYIPITWQKRGRNQPLYYYTTDGRQISLQQGSSYVCIVPISSEVTFS